MAMTHVGEKIFMTANGMHIIEGTVIWTCDLYSGLRFARPLDRVILDHLLSEQPELDENAIADLRKAAERCADLASRRANYASIDALQQLAIDCRVQATVANLVSGLASLEALDGQHDQVNSGYQSRMREADI
jgi:hypothetical protein